jgi:exopolyphosphatase/guanosine-5'-triphosphate,3'-diphosphate pyrophosphatase
VLDAATVRHWLDTLAAEPAADRLGHPGMEPGREDVIVGGVLVLDRVMRRLGFGHCTVSESDILDGLVMSLAEG